MVFRRLGRSREHYFEVLCRSGARLSEPFLRGECHQCIPPISSILVQFSPHHSVDKQRCVRGVWFREGLGAFIPPPLPLGTEIYPKEPMSLQLQDLVQTLLFAKRYALHLQPATPVILLACSLLLACHSFLANSLVSSHSSWFIPLLRSMLPTLRSQNIYYCQPFVVWSMSATPPIQTVGPRSNTKA